MALQPISSPVSMNLYPSLCMMLLLGGACSTGGFFVYEVAKNSKKRNLFGEAVLALVSSVLLGFGTFFLLLWTGVYI